MNCETCKDRHVVPNEYVDEFHTLQVSYRPCPECVEDVTFGASFIAIVAMFLVCWFILMAVFG